jgi:hypothetical protein
METTLSFNDAMARLSETLYSSAKVHVNTRRSGRLAAPKLNADAWEHLTFDLKVNAQGEVNAEVSKYCAGYVLRCTAWIESSETATRFSGSILSSDGGGTEFNNVSSEQAIRFELPTSMWHTTKFSVKLKTLVGLRPGSTVQVRMRIGY